MRLILGFPLLAVCGAIASSPCPSPTPSTQGLTDLIKRRIPSHTEDFIFILQEQSTPENDNYSVSGADGKITIHGNSVSGLATGLRRYLTDVANVDIYWFIGSRLNEVPERLPMPPDGALIGEAGVRWRYYFNTVTFSYTSAFWTWEDWEMQLDWMALHGVNLALAWVGFEKILLDVFREFHLNDTEILAFFSGPAFQAWNRLGNIQGSWGGTLPLSWIQSQFELQKNITSQMKALGITPILPAFTGFVPDAFIKHYPNASISKFSQWGHYDFPGNIMSTNFLDPSDALFTEIQNATIRRQIEELGDITDFYALDQYNENEPTHGTTPDDLRLLANRTTKSLKAADPNAVWVLQSWMFLSSWWTGSRISGFLSGVTTDTDMLILDLFSESTAPPIWPKYGNKTWIWNELHDFGGNMGLYGQVENITAGPVSAERASKNLVGLGLTPEGLEGNEVVYKLLLDQAWSRTPINTTAYFLKWAKTRYAGKSMQVKGLNESWTLLRDSAYNNVITAADSAHQVQAVPKAIFELAPNITGLVDRTGHHPTKIPYNTSAVILAWKEMYTASSLDAGLWTDPAYAHDLVDLTRQVLSNAWEAHYKMLISTWTASNSTGGVSQLIDTLLTLLSALDALLLTLPQFRFSSWICAARASAPPSKDEQDFFEYNARNQVTWWGPSGQISDYASKSWGGLVKDYYLARWTPFLKFLNSTSPEEYQGRVGMVVQEMRRVEERFQRPGSGLGMEMGKGMGMGDVKGVMERSVRPVLEGVGIGI